MKEKWKKFKSFFGHYTFPFFFGINRNNHQEFDFQVNDTWRYSTDANGWSKIWGYSNGMHHKNSNRLVFICEDNQIFVGYYAYIDGVSPQQNKAQKGKLMPIYPGEYHAILHTDDNGYYHVRVWHLSKWSIGAEPDAAFKIPVKVKDHKKWGYILKPYVGGTYKIKGFWTKIRRYFN